MLDDLDVLLVLSVASALAGLAVLVCLAGAARELVRGRRAAFGAVEVERPHVAVADRARDEDAESEEGELELDRHGDEDAGWGPETAWEDEDAGWEPETAWETGAEDEGAWAAEADDAWEPEVEDVAEAHVGEAWAAATALDAATTPEPLPVWVPPDLADGAGTAGDGHAPEPVEEAPAASGIAELARMIDLGDARSRRAADRERRDGDQLDGERRASGRRRRLGRHDRRRGDDAEVPARPRLPVGAERALLSIVEVQPDPRNLLALQRDPTAEVRLTDLDRATAAAARDRIELAAARRRHPTAHVRRSA